MRCVQSRRQCLIFKSIATQPISVKWQLICYNCHWHSLHIKLWINLLALVCQHLLCSSGKVFIFIFAVVYFFALTCKSLNCTSVVSLTPYSLIKCLSGSRIGHLSDHLLETSTNTLAYAHKCISTMFIVAVHWQMRQNSELTYELVKC